MHLINIALTVLAALIGLSISMQYRTSLIWRKSKTIKLVEKREYHHEWRNSGAHRNKNLKTTANTAIYETNDLEYVQKVGIGIPAQEFTLWLKLAASEMYVPHRNCSIKQCQEKKRFVPEKSATFIDYGREPKWGVTIDGVEASGYTGGDVIKIGAASEERLAIPNIRFGVAESIVCDRAVKTDFDGILGLSFSIREPQIKAPQTFIERIIETGIFDEPVFTIWLGARSAQKGVRAGQITYGGSDTTNCGPTIAEISLHLYTSDEYQIDGVKMGDIEYKRGYYAYHTMGSWIRGPQEPVRRMAELAGAQLVEGVFQIPCSATFPDFDIYIGNVTLTIASENLVLQLDDGRCIFGMLPLDTDFYWIIGAPFHREYCTTFDVGTKRLLFSKIVSGERESTAASSSDPTTTPSLSTATPVRSSGTECAASTAAYTPTTKLSSVEYQHHCYLIIEITVAFILSSRFF